MSMLSKLEENIPSLRRYAWSLMRQSSDADDLVQDCLVRALDRIENDAIVLDDIQGLCCNPSLKAHEGAWSVGGPVRPLRA